jgi:CHAD domain-containing protein
VSYRLEPGEKVGPGVKRIIKEQIDQSVSGLEGPDDRDEVVHDVRKRLKKIRAALRLVRLEIGEDVYKPENICYRDAGRRLSPVRDSFVKVETLDLLLDRYGDYLDAEALEPLRGRLLTRHADTVTKVLDGGHAMEDVLDTLRDARARVDALPIEATGTDAFYGGLRKVYKRGHNRLADAYDDPTVGAFHEWRKRVKYLWYHERILENVWAPVLEEMADQTHDLSDYLGDAHDLAELRALLKGDPDLVSIAPRDLVIGLLNQEEDRLRTAARPVGERIYLESPDAFTDRLAGYWNVWKTTY